MTPLRFGAIADDLAGACDLSHAGDTIVVTPTGSALSRVREQDLAQVVVGTGRDAPRIAPGPVPSKELPLHLALYRGRPDTGAVVHLHSPHATAISCLPPDPGGNADLPALTPYRGMRLGTVPLVHYEAPGSAALAEELETAAQLTLLVRGANPRGANPVGIDPDSLGARL